MNNVCLDSFLDKVLKKFFVNFLANTYYLISMIYMVYSTFDFEIYATLILIAIAVEMYYNSDNNKKIKFYNRREEDFCMKDFLFKLLLIFGLVISILRIFNYEYKEDFKVVMNANILFNEENKEVILVVPHENKYIKLNDINSKQNLYFDQLKEKYNNGYTNFIYRENNSLFSDYKTKVFYLEKMSLENSIKKEKEEPLFYFNRAQYKG